MEYDWEVPTVGLELPAIVKPKLLPALMLAEEEAKPALMLRCGCDKVLTTIWWSPIEAAAVAVTLTAEVLLLATVSVLKLSRSLTALRAVLNSFIMNITADKPLTLLSFFAIFALIAFSCGIFSALTKFCAKEATSTPEPAFNEVMIFCALALLAAATSAAVVAAVVELELTAEVAMGFREGSSNESDQAKKT